MRASLLLGLLLAASAFAEEAAHADEKVPDWVSGKAKVPDIEQKVEGGFPDAMPLIAYDSNTGLGLGLGAHYTFNGSRTDALFAYTPYRHRLYAQGYVTTGGYQQHILSYDAYSIGNSPYRLRAVASFERNTNANYFGNGESTLADLNYAGAHYGSYDDAVAAVGSKYYHWGYNKPQGQVTLDRGFWGGRLRTIYGVNVQNVSITRYDSTAAFGPTTKLGEDCAAKRALGCEGGWNNTLRAGVAFDTRDYDPDPNSGVFIDAMGQWSAKGFGSVADYLRLTMAARGYFSPFPKLTDLVIAGRAFYSIQSASVPFFSMNTLAMAGGTDDATDQTGLGGERTLRGFRQDRFIGHVAAAANLEVRWTFAKFPLFKQRISLQAAPFVDAGRVFDRVAFSFEDWKFSAGGGLRVGVNQSTIVMFDFGASREDMGFYIDFGMPF